MTEKMYMTEKINIPEKINMTENIVNQITLDCLINKYIYDKYLQHSIAKINNKKDKKFYRKRIFSLTKELLSSEQPDNLFPDIKYAFENYINACINYFKTIDNNDIIQEDYTVFNEISKISLELDPNENMLSKEDSDKLMMRSVNMTTPTMDAFVTKKYIKKPEEMILPKQKNINLTDPVLKRKGVIISEKKKNIANKYDETNNTENKTDI